MLPPQQRGVGPEPELLTHRELDYDEDLNDDPDLYYDEEDEVPLSGADRGQRRKKVWKRVRRAAYVLTALMIIGPIVAFFVAYQMVEVPDANAVAASQGQVVTLQWGDGSLLTKIVPPGGNRTMVRYDQLPDTVKHAVFAAEDAEFMTNPGFDIAGVMRAGWNQIGGGAGGGSTITQQYIKKATGNDEASGLGGYSRKFTEVVKAYKMNNTYSKEKILESYLNTIYFGRGANGIVAAGRAYFGKELKDLTPSEAALLGGMIQSPGRYQEQDYMDRRWNFVMDQMVQKGWLSAGERKTATFPTLIDMTAARPTALEGPNAHIQTAVLKEIKKETNMDLDVLQQKGYTVQTTIDPLAQQIAIDAVNGVTAGQPPNILPALVAVDPTNGEIKAYYGGKDGNGLDWAAQPQEPGSSFKPFDLVALLEKGKGLGETYDGTNGRVFVEGGPPIRNSGNATCGKECTVAEAMKRSINTVFYDIALNEVGTKKVADAAKQAGINSPLMGPNGAAPDANISIGGGNTQVTTTEMASAYATFAANGIKRTPHLVKQILTPDGQPVWTPKQQGIDGVPAFDGNSATNAKIARNVTESLLPIPASSKIACDGGRKCAGKTGTHQYGETADNAKAWMVGYTPQISVAVSMGAEENNKQMPLKNAKGDIVYGSGLPGHIWQAFMNTYLKGKDKLDFGKFTAIGKPVGKSDDESKKKDKPSNTQTNNTQTNNTPPPGGDGGENNNPSTNPSSPTGTTDPGGPGGPGGGGGGGACLPPLGCNTDGPGRNNNN
jgi:membrane peptidoglycan carboxypeptidase